MAQQDVVRQLHDKHRATHLAEAHTLRLGCHTSLLQRWRVEDPRFIAHLEMAGVGELRHVRHIRLDHQLITALVERWWPHTNTFHLPCGEMTITLQDVAVILGIRIDGTPLIDHPVIGNEWPDWPSCCQELLGDYPRPELPLRNPFIGDIDVGDEAEDHEPTVAFDMGQAKSKTALPLRWLLWRFGAKTDFTHEDDLTIIQHVRAYIMFIIGAMLMPDTSGNEVHCRWLPLLRDLSIFSEYSLGSATLAHLYRELYEAVDPRRHRVSGCLYLLQVWAWEHLHVGRPILLVPGLAHDHMGPLGSRWNPERVKEFPQHALLFYRNEFDIHQQSQVIWTPYDHILCRLPPICSNGSDIWRARVPLISWVRVEWHLPERVVRQFGFQQHTNLVPMDQHERASARGKLNKDWFIEHAKYREMWDQRKQFIQQPVHVSDDAELALKIYMTWYKQSSVLYSIAAPVEPSRNYYPRGQLEKDLIRYWGQTSNLAHAAREQPSSVSHYYLSEICQLADMMRETLQLSGYQSRAHTSENPDLSLCLSREHHESAHRTTGNGAPPNRRGRRKRS